MRILLLLMIGVSLSAGELIQFADPVPVKVPAWTRSEVTGMIPEKWTTECSSRAVAECSVKSGVFECELKKGKISFLIPAPELKTAVPAEFYITLERPSEDSNESVLCVEGGKTPSLWGGTLIEGLVLDYAQGIQTFKGTVNAPAWQKNKCYWLLLEFNDPGLYKVYSLGIRDLPPGQPYYAMRPEVQNRRNLFRNSRLPLGLQNGWSCGNEYQDALEISTDTGPSGERYTILNSDRPDMPFNTETFSPEDFSQKNYVSFSYRATGKWHARVFTGEGSSLEDGNTNLPPTTEWKRVMIAYTPCENARGHMIQIRGEGRLEVDAFRANPDPDSTYLPQMETELALAVSESTDAAYSRIFFADEPAHAIYKLTGETAGSKLHFKIVDLYGSETELPVQTMPEGKIDLSAAFSKHPFGQFRLEAYAERNGQVISPVNELVFSRIERPLYWGKDAPNSYFGGFPACDRSIVSLKAAGGNHSRFHDHGGIQYVGWRYLEPEPGKWYFRDSDLERYRKLNLRILGEFGTTPLWATHEADNPKLKNDWRARWLIPKDLDQFRNYVKTVSTRYHGQIEEWGVGNEPWGGFFNERYQNGRYVRGEQNKNFAEYQKAAYESAKAVDPQLKIAGINASFRTPSWADGLYKRGMNNYCDVIEMHLYSSAWNGFPEDEIGRKTKLGLGTSPWTKEVWNTEGQGVVSGRIGVPAEPQVGIYKYSIPWISQYDFRAPADKEVRYLVSSIANGIKRIYQYSGRKMQYVSINKPAAFAVLEQPDGYPAPQLAAHSALARRIDGKTFGGVFEIAPQVWCYLFEGNEQCTAVLIPRRGTPKRKIPIPFSKAEAADLFGNPLPLPLEVNNESCYLSISGNAENFKKAFQR